MAHIFLVSFSLCFRLIMFLKAVMEWHKKFTGFVGRERQENLNFRCEHKRYEEKGWSLEVCRFKVMKNL